MPISNLREFDATDPRGRTLLVWLGSGLLALGAVLELWALLDDRTTTVVTDGGTIKTTVEAATPAPGLVATCLALGTLALLTAALFGRLGATPTPQPAPADDFVLAPETLTRVARAVADLVGTEPDAFAAVFGGAVADLLAGAAPDPGPGDRGRQEDALIRAAVSRAAQDAGIAVPRTPR